MTIRETRRAAELLRVLAQAEIARIEGDLRRSDSLLDAVDPVECRRLADSLNFDAGIRALHRNIRPDRPERSRTAW